MLHATKLSLQEFGVAALSMKMNDLVMSFGGKP